MAHMANTGTYSMGKPNLVAVSDKILPERAPTVSMGMKIPPGTPLPKLTLVKSNFTTKLNY